MAPGGDVDDAPAKEVWLESKQGVFGAAGTDNTLSADAVWHCELLRRLLLPLSLCREGGS